VEEFAALNARISEAAERADRDPATLERSVCVYVQLEGPPERDSGADPIMGTPEEIHARLREFAQAGADEVMLVVSPITEASIRALAPR
jgi:alkanesulfonate monooxygenase SsuD/methylene tetrahydromethanopterin reductase-like flavin-dependent oxidoreductase (luciferase family)